MYSFKGGKQSHRKIANARKEAYAYLKTHPKTTFVEIKDEKGKDVGWVAQHYIHTREYENTIFFIGDNDFWILLPSGNLGRKMPKTRR